MRICLNRNADMRISSPPRTSNVGVRRLEIQHHPRRHAIDLCAQFVCTSATAKPLRPAAIRINHHLQVIHALGRLGDDILRTTQLFHHTGGALRQRAEHVQVRPEDFDGQIATAAGQHFGHTRLNAVWVRPVSIPGKSASTLHQPHRPAALSGAYAIAIWV